jgi:hypothetical protein
MKIRRLVLENVRVFQNLVLDEIPDLVVLVSPNGFGKSTILEAIVGAHDFVKPYQNSPYRFRAAHRSGGAVPQWPPFLRPPVRIGSDSARVTLEVEADSGERDLLQQKGIREERGEATFTVADGKFVLLQQTSPLVEELFSFHPLASGVGYVDYISPIRFYPQQGHWGCSRVRPRRGPLLPRADRVGAGRGGSRLCPRSAPYSAIGSRSSSLRGA